MEAVDVRSGGSTLTYKEGGQWIDAGARCGEGNKVIMGVEGCTTKKKKKKLCEVH